MSLAAAIARAQAIQQAGAEDMLLAFGNPPTFVLVHGEHTSGSIAAAISIKSIRPVQDDGGRVSRVQPAVIVVRKDALPSWATPIDDLAGSAKVTAGGKTFKVSEVADHGLSLLLTCLRWPDDADA